MGAHSLQRMLPVVMQSLLNADNPVSPAVIKALLAVGLMALSPTWVKKRFQVRETKPVVALSIANPVELRVSHRAPLVTQ